MVGVSDDGARDGLRRVTPVRIGDVVFGLGSVPVIAGPCSVETDYVKHAVAAAEAGATVLRGCVHKPRSWPDRFQGIGDAGLPLLAEARAATGLPIISEPLGEQDVERLVPYVHGFLIGTRSMYNSRLLQAVGRAGLPVILKRGFSATYDEWLGAAHYIRAEGNEQVILCERGIRTFNTEVRNTLDISAIPVMRSLCDLPIIVDPSHAAGRREWVAPLALAAVAAGADGLIIEAHPDPDESWTDSRQALHPHALKAIITSIDGWPSGFGEQVLQSAASDV
ncbi:3-deoxy-D-arabinoheptulosonate-7-phosphate synthase [Actinocrispum wychmicini]|uniref:3-deoxy-D-arabinoheptulosonate-7-phosphate synthase n=2 Tax=Actinocrispum wychmicini TaxID=1213861 RepID=A0A4R2JZH9_9PSEU|nr:3-deoxy-D-arabinoheptulosonate-7-phosphate synthase [Actinocrispum wychmicini]